MEALPGKESSESGMEVYKPTLRVDVTAEPPEENNTSPGVTPKTSATPHVSTNIFVAGIPPHWDEATLYDRFKEFGEIISTKLVHRRHFAFVMFRKAESAHAAINAVHLTHASANSPSVLHVSIAMHDEGVDDLPNSRIFIRGLPQWATKEHLKQSFAPFGTITEAAVLMNSLGQCKGSGFVQFSNIEEATAAIEAKKDIRIDDCDNELEVKYSESAEVRQQRQERNKNRQKHSPKYRQQPPSLPIFTPSIPMAAPVQAIPMLGVPAPIPLFYTPQASTQAPGSPHVIYPTVVTSPPLPMYTTQPGLFDTTPETFPAVGDVYLSGVTMTESALKSFLQNFGEVEMSKILDGDGVVLRMVDRSLHPLLMQQLNGSMFPSGQVMVARLYS
ncbi:putative RNA recognition motif (a k a RRM RBD or RNP domain) [Trypanosoma vivax]|uniref:Putative RNA-binding protein n=1 Tax=Trypanosoma vivax (strain Y486) TaxID=1055687 RepID=G0TTR5_TRYVY|nr:putative RNA-binding protein [Trypanosoma vivax]KAH8614098.1 putative RNA recognition motif (a k a RRM RBD or RNP domain) [Trypanosoma vivax]CCC47346.1 putative RNA-binding protein [Trypanosoma vivax Y486]